jgi:hypothetical protein
MSSLHWYRIQSLTAILINLLASNQLAKNFITGREAAVEVGTEEDT